MNRLATRTLAVLPETVHRPGQRPEAVGIVHLGVGAFHRAQQIDYLDDARAAVPTEAAAWGVCGVSLKTPGARDALGPQDCLYTLVEKSPAGIRRRVLGSLIEARFLAQDRAAIEARLDAPGTRIVSLTITEKGYGHDPATGRLDPTHPEIAHDLAHPEAPQSAVGLIVKALHRRCATHRRPFTVLCCDNLPHNGALVRGLVLACAQMWDAALARWIEKAVSFPATMVDRIVPATTAADIAENDAALGVHDAAPVVCEPFRQWVIEDAFVAGRPPLEHAGAQLVADVAPFEAMKLRLLNGSHSAFAYLGYLAGYEFIYQVAAQEHFMAFMRRLMRDEVAPTLKLPAGVDVAAYQQALTERFANPALPHRTQQIAMDGSQKLPQRLLGTVRDNLAAGRSVELLTLAVSGWMRYASGRDEAGQEIKVSDPLADEFARIGAAHRSDPQALARGFLSLRSIFGEDLPADARFAGKVAGWLAALFADGAARTVARAVQR
jgi:fructuronate reductase